MSAWTETDHYEVGVYWPQADSYGIPDCCGTLAEAAMAVERLKRGHFGAGLASPGCPPSEIHIRHVRVRLVPLLQLEEASHG